MAWVRFKDPRFLTAADWAIRSLEERPVEQSPLYEVLLPYGALAAARMNAELDRDYDVAKLVNDCFEPRGRPQARPGWGVISDRWNGLDAHGLVGSTTDGEGYAFAMNTFQWAGALVPLARYDTRYAHDIGKWMLNLANAARLFYPNAHDAEHQSSYAWATAHDGKSAIAYEGIRKWKRGVGRRLCRLSARRAEESCREVSRRRIFAARRRPICRYSKRRPAMELRLNTSGNSIFPKRGKRWLVVAAERIDGGHVGNVFRFSFASRSRRAVHARFLGVRRRIRLKWSNCPPHFENKLYVKAESSDRSLGWSGQDQLSVDAMAISYRSDIGPFAQGDQVVTFIDLLEEATVADRALSPRFGDDGSGSVRQFARGHSRRHHQADQRRRHSATGPAEDGLLPRRSVSHLSLLQPPRFDQDRRDRRRARGDGHLRRGRAISCSKRMFAAARTFTIPADTATIVVLAPAGRRTAARRQSGL